MKERPILFTGEMVLAILEGRKNQTRRVMKQQPEYDMEYSCWQWPSNRYQTMIDLPLARTCAPLGKAGDRLWVRETFYCDDYQYEVRPDDDLKPALLGAMEYRATHDCRNWEAGCPCSSDGRSHWRSPIFMPRWVSRIDLEITNVRVERLQDISDLDVLAEGVDQQGGSVDKTNLTRALGELVFRPLWDSINAKRGYSWGSNPWVWAYDFKATRT